MNNAVGIDVSKGESMVAILRPFGEVVLPPLKVCHTSEELKQLVKIIKELDGDTKVVLEATGKYHLPIVSVLSENGISVTSVNPKLIKNFNNNSLRNVKSDKADSIKIAQYCLTNWNEIHCSVALDSVRAQLKTLNRQYDLFTKSKTMHKNNLIALLDQTFPGINRVFSSGAKKDGTQKWVQFVDRFWHADCVRKYSLREFSNKYLSWCNKNNYYFSAKTVEEVYLLAKAAITTVPSNDTFKLIVKAAVEQLNTISRSVELMRTEMDRLASTLPEYETVLSMGGVGKSLGPQLIAEIGDVTRFEKRNSLSAFAGVDPSVNQSGSFESVHNRTSKHGSPTLRKTLFLVMSILLQLSPEDDAVYQFLDKKRSEGKPYYVYMTAGANKFLRIYYGKVKSQLA